MKQPGFIPRILRLVLLLSLLIFAFLLYSVLKIRETPSVVVPASPEMKEMALYGHVKALSERIGPRSVYEYDRLNAARDYILSSLKTMGYQPETQTYTYDGRSFSNIVVTIAGKKKPGEVVLIGAHYDTYAGTPGADDNASGVAMLLELCRLIKNDGPDRTIKFVFFTLEEPPVFRTAFMGSTVYADKARKSGEKIVAMICLESLGYYHGEKGGQGFPLPLMSLFFTTTPDFVAVVGNLSSRELVHDVAATLRKTPGVAVETLSTFSFFPGVDFSDHRSFWKEGYPAVMITDTAFFRNPNYHTEQDTIETLDFQRMEALRQGLLQAVRDLTR
jgi:Zn-dependent M28 family amino/carboxypeptidase